MQLNALLSLALQKSMALKNDGRRDTFCGVTKKCFTRVSARICAQVCSVCTIDIHSYRWYSTHQHAYDCSLNTHIQLQILEQYRVESSTAHLLFALCVCGYVTLYVYTYSETNTITLRHTLLRNHLSEDRL
jgi:hypothetical protein